MPKTLTPYQALQAERAAEKAAKQAAKEAAAPKRKGPKGLGLSSKVIKARQAEQTRRSVYAQRRAIQVLISRHRDEYEEIRVAERAAIDAEGGPLPGDQAPSKNGTSA